MKVGVVKTKMSGGGSYVDEHGYGHELFNFKKIDGKVYGYVQPRGLITLNVWVLANMTNS